LLAQQIAGPVIAGRPFIRADQESDFVLKR